MGTILTRAILAGVMTCWAWLAAGAPNPVLPGTADCGVLRFGGAYYLMGMGTNGGVYVSRDLVKWDGPIHVFSMNNTWAMGLSNAEIHACDLALLNGRFHLYWSVNFGELRQIGHAVADSPLGPFTEPVTERPFDGRIDPQAFVDAQGQLYFYTVKFTNGNVIWGQPMRDPWTLSGEAAPLLDAVTGSWETLDHRVNEAPFAVAYRGRYYLLYNANHTSAKFGNYGIGVAESDSPLGFRNESKYGFPLLKDNKEQAQLGASKGPAPGGTELPVKESGEPFVHNCGQPSLVRGPNGFEWWLVYFALYGNDPQRMQAIDRVHFFDRELFVEGPTTPRTPGYHPPPALPTYGDGFDDADTVTKNWIIENGEWRVQGGLLHQDSMVGFAGARCAGGGGTSFIFETALRLDAARGYQAGIISSELIFGLDKEKKSWFAQPRFRYDAIEEHHELAGYFDWSGWHTLRVEKNGLTNYVWLDEVQVGRAVGSGFLSDTRPGLFSRGAAAFDGVMYTRGWDGAGNPTFDWVAADCGTPPTGKWTPSERGLTVARGDGESRVFRGDLLDVYEWSVQVVPGLNTGSNGEVGAYAAYSDESNFVRVAADPQFKRITISGKRNGESIESLSAEVVPRKHRARTPEENGYNLRMVKLPDRIVVFVDGIESLAVPGSWPASQVALFASAASCRFAGVCLYDRSGDLTGGFH